MKSIVYIGCPATERPEAEQALTAAGVSIVWADSAAAALGELQRRDVPVVVDLVHGDSVLQQARQLKHHRPATLMFAVVDPRRADLTLDAIASGIADVFARPLAGRRLASAIQRELRLKGQPLGPAPSLDEEELYGHSRGMRDVKALISRAAGNRSGVLICGEPGTGRRLVAKNIHAHISSAAPFVTIDCVADDPEQVEHQLFGDVARPMNKEGERRRLERVTRDSGLVTASGGTLYLRNVADMPARLQARIARVLRDREATIAGVGQTVGIDIRPIASIAPGMERAVTEGRLRDDLIRRLSTMRIDLPPLRSRREDIPALANYFARDIAARGRMSPKAFSRPALSLISALPWRGNATELRALLEQVVTSAGDQPAITIEDVLAHVRLESGSVAVVERGTLRQARAQFEREYIVSVLDRHQGRISDAARTLGIQRTNLYRKMRSLRVVSKKRQNSQST